MIKSYKFKVTHPYDCWRVESIIRYINEEEEVAFIQICHDNPLDVLIEQIKKIKELA